MNKNCNDDIIYNIKTTTTSSPAMILHIQYSINEATLKIGQLVIFGSIFLLILLLSFTNWNRLLCLRQG